MLFAEIELVPFIPLPLWGTMAVGGAGLLLWYAASSYRRLGRRRWLSIVALMFIGVVLPLVILLNPTWLSRAEPPEGKPHVTILVDYSASMKTEDIQPDGTAQARDRLSVALDWATDAAEELSDRYEVDTKAFSDRVTDAGLLDSDAPESAGSTTDIAGSIEKTVQDRPEGQAVIVLSDGIHNAPGGAAALRASAAKARAMGAPIFAKTLGGETEVRDLAVAVNLPQELAFVDQRVPITVRLQQRGQLLGSTRVTVLLDGEQIDQRTVELAAGRDTETTFEVSQSEPGLYRYEFETESLEGEVTDVNNTATLMLRVVDERVRVLVLEGKPYWDTKFLVRTLAADSSIELDTMVQLAEGRILKRRISRAASAPVPDPGADDATDDTEDKDAAAPAEAVTESWTIEKDARRILSDPAIFDSYQIIVMGRSADRFMSEEALANLKKWLRQSDGSLVCYRGAPSAQVSQHLAELMPVRWTPVRESRFRMRLTESGQQLSWLPSGTNVDEDALVGMPSLATAARPDTKRPVQTSVVLATGLGGQDDAAPAISYQQVGLGRVVVVEGTGMWRWAFLPPKYQQAEQLYGTLWRSLIRWLVAQVQLLPSQQLALRSEKITFNTQEPAGAVLLAREDLAESDLPEIVLSGGELDRPKQVQPVAMPNALGQYRIGLGKLAEGRYQLRAVGADGKTVLTEAGFDVRGNLTERLNVRARPDVMRLLAEQSGGRVADDADAGQIATWFDEHLATIRPERILRTTLWDRWWVLASVLGIWAFAWGLRRKSGLV